MLYNMKMRIAVFALALACAGGMAGSTWAQNNATVLKDRQQLMKEQASDIGVVKHYIDGTADQAKAEAAATGLTHTTAKIPDVFPQGTAGASPDGKFAAKPDIWTDWKSFLEHRDTASQKAQALLAAVKSGDKEKVKTAYADLGKNGCGGCHDKFREKLQ